MEIILLVGQRTFGEIRYSEDLDLDLVYAS